MSKATIMRSLSKQLEQSGAGEILGRPFPVVDSGDSGNIPPSLLDFHPPVLISENGKSQGIITKADLPEVK
jgi:predicted transcriptional regulator